jgi:hypothetical protein
LSIFAKTTNFLGELAQLLTLNLLWYVPIIKWWEEKCMSGTKEKTKSINKNMGLASRRPKRSSKTPTPSLPTTKANQKKLAKSSLDTPLETDNSSSFTLKKMKTKTSESSQQENLEKRTKNPWDGYDFEQAPALTKSQAATFRPISKSEHIRLSRGRPKKSKEEKCVSITVRIEPRLLLLVKQGAKFNGVPWQSYLKILLEKGAGEQAKS